MNDRFGALRDEQNESSTHKMSQRCRYCEKSTEIQVFRDYRNSKSETSIRKLFHSEFDLPYFGVTSV